MGKETLILKRVIFKTIKQCNSPESQVEDIFESIKQNFLPKSELQKVVEEIECSVKYLDGCPDAIQKGSIIAYRKIMAKLKKILGG